MATMITEVYDAFLSAGVSAEKAAKAVASYDNRLNKIEADLSLLKWMVGFVLASQIAIVVKLFVPA